MSITNEAHSSMRKNGESDESLKKMFTAERSRQFDVLQLKKATYHNADSCLKRTSQFLKASISLSTAMAEN